MKPSTPNGNDVAHLQISLYLPYLHWDTYKMLIRRRHLIKRRLSHGRSRPVPEDVAKMDLEHRVIWDYLGHDLPFNCRRTLDQFGYPNLHDTRARDDDQMLYKMTKQRQRRRNKVSGRRRTEHEGDSRFNEKGGPATDQESTDLEERDSDEDEDVLDGTVLMVDQLWLWAISQGEWIAESNQSSATTYLSYDRYNTMQEYSLQLRYNRHIFPSGKYWILAKTSQADVLTARIQTHRWQTS